MEFTGERFVPGASSIDSQLAVEHFHRYYSVLPFVNGKSVLDIACGEGYGSVLLADRAVEVVGIDISEVCIEHARQTYAGSFKNVRFLQGEMQAIPMAASSVDVVVSFESLEHISSVDQKKFIKEVSRVLRSDGLLFISTPNTAIYAEENTAANPFHLHEVDLMEFRSLIQAEFPFLRIYEQGLDVVSVLADRANLSSKNVPVYNWRKNAVMADGKYLLAVASKRALGDLDISSVVLDTGKNFHEISRKYWLANLELEKVGKWAHELDALREKHESEIVSLHNKLRILESTAFGPNAAMPTAPGEFEILMRQIAELRGDLGKIVSRDSHSTQVIAQQSRIISNLELRNRELSLQLDQLSLESQARERLMITVEEAEAQLLRREVTMREEMTEIRNRMEAAELSVQKRGSEIEKLNRANVIAYEQLESQKRKYQHAIEAEESLRKTLSDVEADAAFTRRVLKELETELQRIYDSDGWRLLKRYYKLKGKYLNESSWQYKFLKGLLKRRPNDSSAKRGSHSATVNAQEILPQNYAEEPPLICIPVFETIEVSIIIPVFNAFEMNLRCIKSIVENTQGVSYEIILADDASTDRTSEIEKFVQNLILSRSDQNKGFIMNCNAAAIIAKGRFIHFLNNDTEVTSDWMSSLVAIMNRDERVGLVGSKLIYPDGRLQEAGGIIWKDGSGWNYGNGSDKESPEFNYVREVDYVSGASILVRQKLWIELGGFDEQYSPAYCEDSDLAFRIRQAGYKVVYQPLSVVVHYEGYSHGTDVNAVTGNNIKSYQIANGKKLFNNWQHVLEKEHFENGKHVYWARDRSRSRQSILFIDHYVPHFDKDAGSKTTFHYLNLFLKMGFNVKFIGDNFFRHEPYTTTLQQLGIEVLYGPVYSNKWKDWLGEHADKFDFVYLNRPHIAIKYMDFLRANLKARIIYYGHDLHYLRELRRYQVSGESVHLSESKKWMQTEGSLLSDADLSLTPSVEECKIIRSEFPQSNVHVMRPYIFDSDKVIKPAFEETSDVLFVGGFGHQPNVDAVWWYVKDVWPLITEKLDNARFIIIGSNTPPEFKSIVSERIILMGFVSEEQLARVYRSARVAVVPLRYGAGVKGKTVESMFYGTPIVSTSNGLEGLPGNTEFLTAFDSPTSFADEVVRLYQDADSWEDMSRSGMDYVKSEFSESKALEVLEHALSTTEVKK